VNENVPSFLREEMRFDDVVVSHCLEMDADRTNYGTEKSAVEALEGSLFLWLLSHDYQSPLFQWKLLELLESFLIFSSLLN